MLCFEVEVHSHVDYAAQEDQSDEDSYQQERNQHLESVTSVSTLPRTLEMLHFLNLVIVLFISCYFVLLHIDCSFLLVETDLILQLPTSSRYLSYCWLSKTQENSVDLNKSFLETMQNAAHRQHNQKETDQQ